MAGLAESNIDRIAPSTRPSAKPGGFAPSPSSGRERGAAATGDLVDPEPLGPHDQHPERGDDGAPPERPAPGAAVLATADTIATATAPVSRSPSVRSRVVAATPPTSSSTDTTDAGRRTSRTAPSTANAAAAVAAG